MIKVETIVAVTMAEFQKKIVNAVLPADLALAKEQTLSNIQDILKQAFSQIDQKDNITRMNLFRKLSLQLHPDKLQKTNEPLFHRLSGLDLTEVVQVELNKFQISPDFFKKVASSSVRGAADLFYYLSDRLKPMFWEYKRYPTPIKLLINVLSWLINLVLIIAAIAIIIPLFLVELIMDGIQRVVRLFTNLFTGGQFNIEVNEYRGQPEVIEASAKSFFDAKRQIYSELAAAQIKGSQDEEKYLKFAAMSDEELREEIVKENYQTKHEQMKQSLVNPPNSTATQDKLYQQAQDDLNEKIREFTDISGVQNVVLVAKAFAHSISKPLPKGFFNQVTSLFVRGTQVVAFPFVFIATTAIEGLHYAKTALEMGLVGALIGIKAVPFLLINLPLYVLDLMRFVFNGFKSKSVREEGAHTQPDQTTPSQNSGPEIMQAQLTSIAKSSVDNRPEAVNPGHFNSPLTVKQEDGVNRAALKNDAIESYLGVD